MPYRVTRHRPGSAAVGWRLQAGCYFFCGIYKPQQGSSGCQLTIPDAVGAGQTLKLCSAPDCQSQRVFQCVSIMSVEKLHNDDSTIDSQIWSTFGGKQSSLNSHYDTAESNEKHDSLSKGHPHASGYLMHANEMTVEITRAHGGRLW